MIDNDTHAEPLFDESFLHVGIVFRQKNAFHADLAALNLDSFPDQFSIPFGNEKPFYLHKIKYDEADQIYIATYKQPDSRLVVLLYNE